MCSVVHVVLSLFICSFFFFFNAPPPSEIYTLSLHDALPISNFDVLRLRRNEVGPRDGRDDLHKCAASTETSRRRDRKSTRLNSSHTVISYAVFCLKKKTIKKT